LKQKQNNEDSMLIQKRKISHNIENVERR